jgi:hypothetical protein
MSGPFKSRSNFNDDDDVFLNAMNAKTPEDRNNRRSSFGLDSAADLIGNSKNTSRGSSISGHGFDRPTGTTVNPFDLTRKVPTSGSESMRIHNQPSPEQTTDGQLILKSKSSRQVIKPGCTNPPPVMRDPVRRLQYWFSLHYHNMNMTLLGNLNFIADIVNFKAVRKDCSRSLRH